MNRWLPRLLVFGFIFALVAGGLGWATAESLRLEKNQRESAAREKRAEQIRLALWRLDTTGDGAGTFTAIAPQDVATTYAAASTRSATGDFDGDGTQDVAVFQQQGSTVALSVQRSDGNALLGTQAWASPAGWNVANMLVVAGNFDGDAAHRDDLAVLYRTGSTT